MKDVLEKAMNPFKLFALTDTKKNKIIEKDELKQILVKFGNVKVSDKEVDTFFKSIDRDEDGTISLYEFLNGGKVFRQKLFLLSQVISPTLQVHTYS